MSAEFLTVIAGGVLSLLFSYVPKLNEKFAALDETYKRLIMLGMLVLSTLAIFGLACAGWAADLGLGVSCDQPGAMGLLRAFMLAAMANQTAYALSPRTPGVRKAKALA